MVNQSVALDRAFSALADPTRRALVERLIGGPLSVGDLAKPLPMSLPAVMQHLAVLQSAGLVGSAKVGRVRTCHIEPAALRAAEVWINQQRTTWERRLDALADVLAETTDPAPHADKPSRQRSTT
jgi:DNA-binding transcriptional ArsR family regulator